MTSPLNNSDSVAPDNAQEATPLYRRVLGDHFDLLPQRLRNAHSRTERTDYRGEFQVRRGTGWFRSLLATLAGLPAASDSVPLELTIEPIGDRERWSCRVGEQPMITTQWQSGCLLIEAAGPTRLGLELTADETGLTCEATRAWFLFIPIPRVFSPRVIAKETPTEDGWHVDMKLTLPLVGQVIQYTGNVVPIERPWESESRKQ